MICTSESFSRFASIKICNSIRWTSSSVKRRPKDSVSMFGRNTRNRMNSKPRWNSFAKTLITPNHSLKNSLRKPRKSSHTVAKKQLETRRKRSISSWRLLIRLSHSTRNSKTFSSRHSVKSLMSSSQSFSIRIPNRKRARKSSWSQDICSCVLIHTLNSTIHHSTLISSTKTSNK